MGYAVLAVLGIVIVGAALFMAVVMLVVHAVRDWLGEEGDEDASN